MLENNEKVVFFLLASLLLYQIITPFVSRKYYKLFSPIPVISFFLFYYTVLGPYYFIDEGLTKFKFIEHRPYFFEAWLATLVFMVSLLAGYLVANSPLRLILPRVIHRESYTRYGINLFVIAFIAFAVFAGTGIISFINPVDSTVEGSGYSGALSNYLLLTINFFIPALCLLLINYLKKDFRLWVLIILIIITSFIYISFGFRFRLVILMIALSSTYFLYTKHKPKLLFIIPSLIFGLALMGYIGTTRSYFGGLDITKAKSDDWRSYFWDGFDDAAIFMTTGMLINRIPDKADFLYLDPVIEALVIPIPRKLWPGKPSGDQIQYVYNIYYPGDTEKAKGVAWLLYGEFYMMWGWKGIVIGAFIFGIFLKKLFLWLLQNRENSMGIIIYSLFLGVLYFVISRGYFPQHVMLFFFTIYPAIWINRLIRNKGLHIKRLKQI